jgi:hypothetical protein
MGILKDLFIEQYEAVMSEAEESGKPIKEDVAVDMAYTRARDRFADMCDAAKDRAKYGQ